MSLFRKAKKRVLVLGLDGVPASLLGRLIEQGVMPRMKDLAGKGSLRAMKASLPEISAVSWADFMTGVKSGQHGIFGFTDFKPGSYEIRFPSYADLKAAPVWDQISAKNKRSVVINQPSTYPARPLQGALVSGFVALQLNKAVFPATLLKKLNEIGYSVDIPTMPCRKDHDLCLKELKENLKRQRVLVQQLWKEEDWDFFEVVVTGTDRLHHFVWTSLEDASHPLHSQSMDYYCQIDEFIGDRVGQFLNDPGGDLSRLFLLSDHGFCGIQQEVRLNRWLQEKGFLKFAKESPQEVCDLDPSSQAFFLDPARLYLNRKDRFPGGWIEPDQASRILEEIEAGLRTLECQGNPVIRWTFRGSDVYEGPYAGQSPDLLVVPHWGYDLKATVKEKDLFGRTDLEGMHTWDDAFFWSQAPQEGEFEISRIARLLIDAWD